MDTKMNGVREYCDESAPVELAEILTENYGHRLCVIAYNEGGLASTHVDLLDLIEWLKANRSDVLAKAGLSIVTP